jgi:hypothetical protein
LKTLLCPSDTIPGEPKTGGTNPNFPANRAPRSFLINAWNDYFEQSLSPADFALYMAGSYSNGMRETVVRLPSETVLFGEKTNTSTHFYMDLLEGKGNDFDQLEQKRHITGSDFVFVDGSVRFLKAWKSVGTNVNMWAVTEAGRTNYAFQGD